MTFNLEIWLLEREYLAARTETDLMIERMRL